MYIMVKPLKQNKFREFLEKHKKAVFIYNLLIWTILFILMFVYNAETSTQISREDMIEQIKERCSNEVTIPDGAYNVRFTYNEILNETTCRVIIK